MDQKSENRKRFQDKQRLKRSHQTPSDRKYRKEQLQAAPIPEKKPLPSNHERYVEIEQVQEDITDLTQLSKTKLKENTQPSTSNSKHYTAKQLQQMDVDELNRLLQPTPNNTNTNTTNNNTHTSNAASSGTTNNASSTPLELHDDEDFLDSLL